MIRYLSTFSVKTLHGVVNRGLLKMLLLAFPKAEIKVVATASSIEMLKESLKDIPLESANVSYKSLPVNSAPGRINMLCRYLQSAFFNVVALMRSKPGDTLIYNFNNVFSLQLINYISRKFKKNRKILIVCHGEMEYLANAKKHKAAYKKLMSSLTNGFFLKTNPDKIASGLNFLVLGDIILSELRQYIAPALLNRFYSIDHPVESCATTLSNKFGPLHNSSKKELRLGTVGIMNRYKGGGNYLKLLKYFKGNEKIKFSIVGQVQEDLEEFKELDVTLPKIPEEALPEAEFRHMIEELDYILLFYPSDNYRLIASGALLDTLRFQKPLIAIRTAYFQYFFEKFTPVGILTEDLEEMKNVIESLIDKELPTYNYEEATAKLLPESLSSEFGEIINSLHS